MKASELRIGNYVWEDYGGDYVVTSIHNKFFGTIGLTKPSFKTEGVYLVDEIKPILLTEEWLLKFGFIDNDWAFINNGLELSWSIRRCESGERSCFYLSDKFPEDFQIRVEYVHTLQNLYFALTGEELTIEE